jgi:carboxyl-terminal processing protease
LTTLSYWRPSGKNIHRLENAPESAEWGVVPNPGFEVKLDAQQFERLLKFRRDRDIVKPNNHAAAGSDELFRADPQLKRARDYLAERIDAA